MKMFESTGYLAASRRLLGTELTAFETYTQAIDDIRDDPEREVLLANRSRHAASIDCLMDHLATLGGEMDFASRDRVKFGKVSESAALLALAAGESEILQDCRAALQDPEIPTTLKQDIRDRLIPRLETNVEALEKARQQ
jgi:hypothetical protein